MLYRYVEKGTSLIRVRRKSKSMLYYEKKDNFSIPGSVLGYLYLGDLHKKSKKKMEEKEQIEIRGYYFQIEKTAPDEKLPIKGYLLVKGESEEDYQYVAVYSKHRILGKLNFALILSLSQFSIPSSVVAVTLVTVTVTATAIKVVPMLIEDANIPKTETPIEKTTEESKNDIPKKDTSGVVVYDGKDVVNGETTETSTIPQDSGDYINYLYFDLHIKQGDSIPLVNVPENKAQDTQFNYVIKDKNGVVLVDKWVAPGGTYPWVPNLPIGTNTVTFEVNAWSLDGTKQWIGQTYDVNVTINN